MRGVPGPSASLHPCRFVGGHLPPQLPPLPGWSRLLVAMAWVGRALPNGSRHWRHPRALNVLPGCPRSRWWLTRQTSRQIPPVTVMLLGWHFVSLYRSSPTPAHICAGCFSSKNADMERDMEVRAEGGARLLVRKAREWHRVTTVSLPSQHSFHQRIRSPRPPRQRPSPHPPAHELVPFFAALHLPRRTVQLLQWPSTRTTVSAGGASAVSAGGCHVSGGAGGMSSTPPAAGVSAHAPAAASSSGFGFPLHIRHGSCFAYKRRDTTARHRGGRHPATELEERQSACATRTARQTACNGPHVGAKEASTLAARPQRRCIQAYCASLIPPYPHIQPPRHTALTSTLRSTHPPPPPAACSAQSPLHDAPNTKRDSRAHGRGCQHQDGHGRRSHHDGLVKILSGKDKAQRGRLEPALKRQCDRDRMALPDDPPGDDVANGKAQGVKERRWREHDSP